jgi:hypothetical protein
MLDGLPPAGAWSTSVTLAILGIVDQMSIRSDGADGDIL